MTMCLYLPDGRVAFNFARPHISDNNEHNAGGLRFQVLKPFEEHHLTYAGEVIILEDPTKLEDPKKAFTESPKATCELDQIHRGIAKAWGGEPEAEEGETLPQQDPEKAFARGHFEQHMGITGSVRIGKEEFVIEDALGLRDHSWGPRYWQNIWWYRWYTANLGPDFGFAFTYSGDEQGRKGARGFLYEGAGSDLKPIVRAEVQSDYDERQYHRNVKLKFATPEKEYEVSGEVTSLIPLRNRRAEMMTRITEGMTRWRYGDLEGAGLSEYLDQIVDGKPVGKD
jgi:hypothetical protein